MDGLNQFFISRILGSTMKHTKRPGFGPLGAMHIQNQVLAHRPKEGEQITFTPPVDKLIIRAFQESRNGLAVDRVLADPALAETFIRRCHQLGVKAPIVAINRRLLQFRKSPKGDTRIPRATAREARRNFSQYLFAAEMAISQVRYRFGASVDDMLADPEIGAEFDKLAARLQPGRTSLEYRLAALHVRKSRFCKSEDIPLFEGLKQSYAEKKAEELGALDKLDIDKIDQVNAIVGLAERTRSSSRFLYIAQARSVGEAVKPFVTGGVFSALANSFWSPSLSSIYLVVYNIHELYRNAPQSLWAKRLIHDKTPIFNWPVRKAS